jgi:arabinofuranosyltransferase
MPVALTFTALGLTLLALLTHAWYYRFQCDDAFIAFRYARNLSHGHGLVFNPGLERVEGYTSFLWIVVLSAMDRLGLPPESAADVLSLAATVTLWGMVVWFAARQARPWSVAVVTPVLFLAATRSVAMWSTSGLETRSFEVLAIGGVLRCAAELETMLRSEARHRAMAGWLFGLAALMRPEGVAIALPVVLVSVWILRSRGRAPGRWLVDTILPLLGLVIGQLVFRRLYYGQWLPNTYYAKVGGRTRWDWGLPYIGAFCLEYGAYLWLPYLFIGVRRCFRSSRGHIPILFAAAVLPLSVATAAIGGDHFEYRALDPLFPLVFLLLGEGLTALAGDPPGRIAAILSVVLILFGLCDIPFRSHQEFPARYASGFPGQGSEGVGSRAAFLAPDRDPVLRLPGLRVIAASHQALTRFLTQHFVAIRQEEHRLFLEKAVAQGLRLHDLVTEKLLPPDARIAVDCVGAIPYYSNLLVLDRHGLTDAVVARREPSLPEIMAHERVAGIEDARRFGVELWAQDPVELVVPITSPRLLFAMTHPAGEALPAFVAPVDSGYLLLCSLPTGRGRVQARMPRLQLTSVLDTGFARAYVAKATPAFRELLQRQPDDQDAMNCLAFLLLVQHRVQDALAVYQALARLRPEDTDVWERIALCGQRLGQTRDERDALEHELALARSRGDSELVGRTLARLQVLDGPK